jgi:hypothetical protein
VDSAGIKIRCDKGFVIKIPFNEVVQYLELIPGNSKQFIQIGSSFDTLIIADLEDAVVAPTTNAGALFP